MKFYHCSECNQIYTRLIDHGNQMMCCGLPTEVLQNTNTPEESKAHRAQIKRIGNFVDILVGEEHPMIDVHHILFIYLVTNQGFQYKEVHTQSLAKVSFILAKGEEIVNVHVLCNVHLLWSLT